MVNNILSLGHRYISDLGEKVISIVEGLGRFSEYNSRVLYWTIKTPYRLSLFFDQMYYIGNKSIFIVLLTGLFSGMVFAYQTYLGFSIINADSLIGPLVAVSLAKELAPVLSGLIVAGRCGAAMAAQIGTMKVTEQVDALEVMGISGIQYLGVPRVWATFFSLPLLAILFQIIGNFGSWMIGTQVIGIDEVIYYSKLSEFMTISNLAEGIIKAFFFGYLIAIIGTYQGFNVRGGAEGVGKGTNMAVVWGMVVVLILDFFLTSFLTKIL